MSIAYGGIIAFLFRGLNLAVALSTVVFTSHEMSNDDYGLFVLGLTAVGIVNAATGGLAAATAYQVANQRKTPATALLNGGLVAATIGVVAVVAGLGGTGVLAGEAGRVSIAVGAAAAAVILTSVVAGTFLGREALVRYNVALVTPPLFSLVSIAVTFVALDHRTPEAAMGAFAAGQWLALALLLALGGRSLTRGGGLERGLVRAVVRFALFAGLASGVSYLNYRADLFVVRHFEGESGVATYSLAVYLAESVWQVSGSLALATYARVGSLTRGEAAELTTRVMRHTIVMLTVVCAVLFAAADVIEAVLFKKYGGMSSALRLILPGVLLYGLAQSWSGFYTYQRGWPWLSAVMAGSGLTIDIAMAFVLIPRMGVNGAALASTIAYGSAIIGGLTFFVRSERLNPVRAFRFGRRDVEDYRALVLRLWGGVRREGVKV